MSLRDDITVAVDQITTLFSEMRHANDRVAAISCAAWLDEALSTAIATRFIRLGKEWKERVFDSQNAPLNPFHGKIVIAYALGIYGPRTNSDLNIIRWVRNQFAHSANPVAFARSDISERCIKLTSSRIYTEGIAGSLTDEATPKQHYVHASQRISTQLLVFARANQIAYQPRHQESLP